MTSDRHAHARRREERAATLWAEGVRETRILAAALGVDTRSVRRIIIRLGLDTPRPGNAHVDRERILALATEGMPATFISEDTGVYYTTIQGMIKDVPGRKEAIAEWNAVWQEIRKSERLLELHYELAPIWSTSRGARAQRQLDAA